MTRFLFISFVILNSTFARAETLNGAQTLEDAYTVLNSITTDYILNVEACVDSAGRFAVIYSRDFRTPVAYVYDSEAQEFNAPIPFEQLNLKFGKKVEVQKTIEIFEAQLGNLGVTCAKDLLVLETPM